MTEPKEIVVDVDFYQFDNVPEKIMKEAEVKGEVRLPPLIPRMMPIVAVKTVFVMSNPVRIKYIIETVGWTPAEIKAYMHKLAKEDGCDLNQAVKRAFGED
ncbi:MAG: hypothetical protein MUP55_01030 [Candidatus Aenigmarchaeota archaeon]|nr:hypothetical protein [Candidatus Aenigmarchaeota archaeon]